MKDIISVVDEDGNRFDVEVLDIFNVEGFNNDYILYTRNVLVDQENVETYVSILKEENDNYNLLNIEDENEWNTVQKAILEMGDYSE